MSDIKHIPLEENEQDSVMAILDEAGLLWFDSRVEKLKKGCGRVSRWKGFPDILVLSLAPCNDRPTAIEMKREDADERALSAKQEDWRDWLVGEEWNWILGAGNEATVESLLALGYEIRGVANIAKSKLDRVDVANRFLAIVSSHGTNAFLCNDAVSSFEIADNGFICLRDKKTDSLIFTHNRHKWHEFTDDENARLIVEGLREYIRGNGSLPIGLISRLDGYSTDIDIIKKQLEELD